jgi:tetratricopeptide (TPR) repeat protein
MPREALHWYQKATQGKEELVQAIFYNDAPPDKIFYQGMSWRKLGRQEKADAIFLNMIAFADKHLNDSVQMDYFAVSFPDMHVLDTDLTLRNKVHCLYIRGLGCLGLGKGRLVEAIEAFDEALKLDINHQGASVHKQLCGNRTIIH